MAEPIPSPPSRRWPQRNFAFVMIAAGLLILLASSELLGDALWSVLLPLAMLAVGADLVTEGRQRRRVVGGALLAAVLLVPLLAGAEFVDRGRDVSASWITDERITSADVDRLEARINQRGGNVRVSALDSDSNQLADFGKRGHDGRLSLNGRTAVLELGGGLSNGNIDLELSRDVPLNLRIDVGGGNADPIDLEDVSLQSLDLHVTGGNAKVILPDSGAMKVSVEVFGGNVKLEIPEDVAARIEADATMGNVDLDDRFQQHGNVYFTEDYDASNPNRVDVQVTSRAGNINVD